MDTFPELYTERLHLRRITADDIPSLVKYANNKRISEQVLNIPYPYEEPQAVFRISYVLQGFKAKSRYVFAMILRASGEFVGEIGLHLDSGKGLAQLGYWLGEPHWNKGLVTEAVGAVLKCGFEKIGLEEIFATCNKGNTGSVRVLEKNYLKAQGAVGSIEQYVISKEDFLRQS
jgi:[ribosomal protein S5]-alanine N-acetyltransferase